jgi:hypothetical protein
LTLPVVAFEGRKCLAVVGDVGGGTTGTSTGVFEGILEGVIVSYGGLK